MIRLTAAGCGEVGLTAAGCEEVGRRERRGGDWLCRLGC